MASQGPLQPTGGIQIVDASRTAWITPINVSGCGAAYATCPLPPSVKSRLLRGNAFGFTIPASATIDGIEFSCQQLGSAINEIADDTVQLSIAGAASGTNKATAAFWPTIVGLATYGGNADLWGLTPTPAQVNATNFGVFVASRDASGAGGTASMNCHKITVYYTVPAVAGQQRMMRSIGG